MSRSASVRVQVPGEPAPADAADVPQTEEGAEAQHEASAPEPDTADQAAPQVADADDVTLLRAKLAQLEAENEELKNQPAAIAPKITDSVVFEPVTPHGIQALSASEFKHLTCAQVDAKLRSGEITLGGRPSVLCADGYFCDPAYR